MSDIDEKVTELSKKYFPHLTSIPSKDPRYHLFFQDGAKFMETKENYYDIIITDSTDPTGPALSIFNKDYIEYHQKAFTHEKTCFSFNLSFLLCRQSRGTVH